MTSAAFSARSRKRSSDPRSAAWSRRCSVMSKNVQMTPVISPSSSTSGCVATLIHTAPRSSSDRAPITKPLRASPGAQRAHRRASRRGGNGLPSSSMSSSPCVKRPLTPPTGSPSTARSLARAGCSPAGPCPPGRTRRPRRSSASSRPVAGNRGGALGSRAGVDDELSEARHGRRRQTRPHATAALPRAPRRAPRPHGAARRRRRRARRAPPARR